MKKVEFFDCTIADLSWDIREIYLLMGYGSHIPEEGVRQLIQEILDELSHRLVPHYGYVLVDGNVPERGKLLLDNQLFNPGAIISHAMKGAEKYAVFTATIGEEFDNFSRQLKAEDDILRVFIADALGSVLAEATVTLLMKQLEVMADKEGMHISNNYSPGYCDWFLAEQKQLFSFFPEGSTGITLTDSCLMLPVKSVSGIVALGKDVKRREYGCNICKMVNCIKNKKK
ncbi:vitamin B12 dependent-methionine synthase activation domain-containing protein [uncultured Bacteroides sp.]|uniref:vitamin B12 dependent-methionine synthase activation domain-containing protein n=1 Tax=uncultured Bacteroides sp. TaxID=162156 RepID=UPI0025F70A7A|nr:vitamin B12 dependent-methionine synthase activation domain-containing protein [uncultured Bacteroides sp.]